MEFQPDYSKLASAKLPPEELQAAFSTMLMNAAAIDCGSAAAINRIANIDGEGSVNSVIRGFCRP